MADSITLDALMQSKGHTALQVQKPASVEAVRAQVEELSPEQKARVEEVKNSIDLMDSQAALQYGVGAQRNISSFSDNILTQVRSKDSGYVGELMSDLVLKVKEVDVDGLDEGFWDKIPFLKNASRAVKKFMQRYEKLEVQIDRIEQQLDQARMQMLKDITMFDGLYEKNLEYFRELQIYIAAGEEKLQELQETTLPQLRAEAAAKGDAMSAQVVRDFEDTVNRFEKKIHDLKLSKTVAIQTAPQIRLIQNNDKMLVDKIQTAVLNTIPIWKSQIVIALGLSRQQKVLHRQSREDGPKRLNQKRHSLVTLLLPMCLARRAFTACTAAAQKPRIRNPKNGSAGASPRIPESKPEASHASPVRSQPRRAACAHRKIPAPIVQPSASARTAGRTCVGAYSFRRESTMELAICSAAVIPSAAIDPGNQRSASSAAGIQQAAEIASTMPGRAQPGRKFPATHRTTAASTDCTRMRIAKGSACESEKHTAAGYMPSAATRSGLRSSSPFPNTAPIRRRSPFCFTADVPPFGARRSRPDQAPARTRWRSGRQSRPFARMRPHGAFPSAAPRPARRTRSGLLWCAEK